MPRTGMLWRHIIINTLGTWLHGDERGFRSRDHRVHSTGDYKRKPPKGEHFGLHEYQELRSNEIVIARPLRNLMGIAMVEYLLSVGYRVLAIAVTKVHAHAIVELPEDRKTVKRIAGQIKRDLRARSRLSFPDGSGEREERSRSSGIESILLQRRITCFTIRDRALGHGHARTSIAAVALGESAR